MRFKNRFIIAFAAVVMLQAALCPTLCVAALSIESLDVSQNAEQANSSSSGRGCHGRSADVAVANADADSVPSGMPESPATGGECSDCGDDVLLSQAAQYDSPDLHVSPLLAFWIVPERTATLRYTVGALEERPPPRPLFLLKNSFLI